MVCTAGRRSNLAKAVSPGEELRKLRMETEEGWARLGVTL